MNDRPNPLAGYVVGSRETPAAVILRRHQDGHLSADIRGNIPPAELIHALRTVVEFMENNPDHTMGEYDQDGNPKLRPES